MLRRLNKKGQSTGEYAIVFAIVLGAVIAMQTYVRRSIQHGLRGGTRYLVNRAYEGMNKIDKSISAVPAEADYQYTIRASREETEKIGDQTESQYYKKVPGLDYAGIKATSTGTVPGEDKSFTELDYTK